MIRNNHPVTGGMIRKGFDAPGGCRPRRVGVPHDARTTYYRLSEFPGYRIIRPLTLRPVPLRGTGGARGGGTGLFPGFPLFFVRPQASAATVSAQVSSLVRIASSEYEVRLTLCRPNVTI